MNAHRIGIGALVAGLLLTGWGLFVRDPATNEPAAASPTIENVTTIDQPVQGGTPVDDIIALWQGKADTQAQDYISRSRLGDAYAQRARETGDLDDYERAEAAHRDALRLNPTWPAARLGLATSLAAQHEFPEALTLARGVVEEDPGALAARAVVGDTSLELGDYAAASAAYAELATVGESAAVLSRLARLAAVETGPADAVRLAQRALDASRGEALRPDQRAFYWFQVGHYRFVAGNIDGSIAALRTALDIDPGHPAANEKLPFVLASTGRTTEALAAYEALLADGGAADVHGLYAELLAADGQMETAAEQEELAIAAAEETQDRYPAERRHLVGFYLSRDPALAVELAELDLATRGDIGAHDTLAWALHHAGRPTEAAAAMDQALRLDTRDPALRYHAAAIAVANGDPADARRHLAVTFATNPTFHPTEGADAAALAEELGLE